MRIIRIFGNILLLALLWGLIFSPKKALAMTLPPLLAHEGLTIEQPLTLSSDPAKDITASLSFGEQKEVAMIAPKEQEVLVEAIVVPTVSEEIVEIDDVSASAVTLSLNKTKKTSFTPTPLPTNAKITSVTPTTPPISTPSPLAQTVSPTIQLSNGGLNADKLFSMSNSYRQGKGLPPFQKDDRSCQLAVSRAPEINAEIAEGHMHSGLRARNLSYWNTENIISMRSEEEAFNWWINDTIHREQIEGNFTYSCVACLGNACAQEFTNFQPK